MKRFLSQSLALGLVMLSLGVGCSSKDDEQKTAAPPIDTYCMQYGQQDRARCPGFNYQQYGTYNYNNYGTYGNGYGYGYGGVSPTYAQWASYSWNQGGCSAGYSPVYSTFGFACYAAQVNMNYYYYQGYLLACGPDYSGICPSGYVCSNNYGAGVCAR